MSDDTQKKLPVDDSKKLDKGDETMKLKSGDDLALEALNKSASQSSNVDDELAESEKLAETLTSLQNLIERSANELQGLSNQIKEKRQMLKNVFDNDTQLTEAQEKVDEFSQELKTRKSHLQSNPQVTSLKVEIGELNQQKKELEESLSNHLVNLYSLTNSTSFDTSDGDQWEFRIKAKIKTKKS